MPEFPSWGEIRVLILFNGLIRWVLFLCFLPVHRTPLHCAASCNNVQICKFLVESGAAVFASTYSDMQTAADKCEEMEEGYAQCSQFLYGTTKRRPQRKRLSHHKLLCLFTSRVC